MAKITSNKFACNYCEKLFTSAQAVRGHLRHCRYRLMQQAATKTQAEPAQSVSVHHESRRSGPHSQETKLFLLEVYEKIKHLRQTSLDFATVTILLGRLGVPDKYENGRKWMQLSLTFTEIERDFDQMVMSLRLDRSRLFDMYLRMPGLRNRWMSYRIRDLTPRPDQEIDLELRESLRKEEEMWDAIMINVKKMYVASHQ